MHAKATTTINNAEAHYEQLNQTANSARIYTSGSTNRSSNIQSRAIRRRRKITNSWQHRNKWNSTNNRKRSNNWSRAKNRIPRRDWSRNQLGRRNIASYARRGRKRKPTRARNVHRRAHNRKIKANTRTQTSRLICARYVVRLYWILLFCVVRAD